MSDAPGLDRKDRPHGPSNWNLPNALTVSRILLVPVFGWLLLESQGSTIQNRLLAAAVFVAAMITDKIDGDLARSRNLVTDFGKITDPVADKAMVSMAFVGLSIIDVVWWWVTIVVLVREFGITLVRLLVIRHGVMPAGRGGKWKTFLQTVALALLIPPTWAIPGGTIVLWVGYAVLAVAVLLTVVTGVDYVIKAIKLRRTSPRTMARNMARRTGRVDLPNPFTEDH